MALKIKTLFIAAYQSSSVQMYMSHVFYCQNYHKNSANAIVHSTSNGIDEIVVEAAI